MKSRIGGSGLALLALLLTGCASTSKDFPPAGEEYGELYDGKSKVAYATEFPVGSFTEAETRGDRAARAGDLDLALYHYIQALNLKRGHADTLFKIGSIHRIRNNDRLSALAFQMTLNANSGHTAALEGLGLLLLDARRYHEAQETLEKVIRQEPTRWAAHSGLGILADLEGNFSEAAEHYRKAQQLNPNSATVANNLAYSLYLDGRIDEAIESLRGALNLDENFERAWMNLGLMQARKGNYQEALVAFKQVMDEPEAYNNIGYICLLEGRNEDAERFLRKAIEQSPTYFVAATENLKRITSTGL
jgi:Flp pilus assembly protein TadD